MGSIRTPRSGIRGTPVRARPDIRTDKRIRQVAIGTTESVRKLKLVLYFIVQIQNFKSTFDSWNQLLNVFLKLIRFQKLQLDLN